MIRAVVKKGVIQPLDPLPSEWQDRKEVVVDDALNEQSLNGAEDLNAWCEALTADLNDPQEWEQIDALLVEADRQSKALVRREMGLPRCRDSCRMRLPYESNCRSNVCKWRA
jgi:hypothetical protein